MAQQGNVPSRRQGAKGEKPSTLKIRTFENGEEDAAKTVTIPLGVLRVARKLVPERALAAMREEGIDVDGLFDLSQNQEGPTTILEVEEHKRKRKVIISVE